MKSIKNIAFSALLAVGAFSAITYTSCNKDECEDVVCSNGGTCVNGSCSCKTGYEGTSCQTESRTKFVKSWSVNETTAGTPLVYTCPIASAGSSAAVTDVIIGNAFADNFFANNLTGRINASNANVLDIPTQKPDANGDYSVSGTLTYSNGTLTSSYTITETSTSQTVNVSGTWQ